MHGSPFAPRVRATLLLSTIAYVGCEQQPQTIKIPLASSPAVPEISAKAERPGGHGSAEDGDGPTSIDPRVATRVEKPGLRMGAVEAGKLIEAHQGPVRSLAFSGDGSLLITAGYDKVVKVWNVSDGELVHRLAEGEAADINCVAISDDGHFGLAGYSDGSIRAWDLETGHLLHRFSTDSSVSVLACSADGTLFTSAGADQNVRVWDLAAKEEVRRDHQVLAVSALAFTPDGTHVLIGLPPDGIGHLRVDGDDASKWLIHPEQTKMPVQSIAVAPDGKHLVAAAEGALFHASLGPASDGLMLETTDPGYVSIRQQKHIDVAYSADGEHLLAFAGRGGVEARSRATTHRALYSKGDESDLSASAIAATGRLAASGHWGGSVQLWNIVEVPELRSFKTEKWIEELQDLRERGEYVELDRIAAELAEKQPRAETGERQLSLFYAAFVNELYKPDINWDEELAELEKWAAARPESAAARTLLGAFYVQYAWDARGGPIALLVSPEGAMSFEDRLEKAANYLEEAISLATNDPEPYASLVKCGQGLGWDKERVFELAKKSQAIDPEYYPTYMMVAEYLLPRWHGELHDIRDWTSEMADDIGGELGDEMYFRTLSRVACYETSTMFEELDLDYQRARRGGESILRRYPQNYQTSNNDVINFLARFACSKGDQRDAREYLTDVAGAWNKRVWFDQDRFNQWKNWAGVR